MYINMRTTRRNRNNRPRRRNGGFSTLTVDFAGAVSQLNPGAKKDLVLTPKSLGLSGAIAQNRPIRVLSLTTTVSPTANEDNSTRTFQSAIYGNLDASAPSIVAISVPKLCTQATPKTWTLRTPAMTDYSLVAADDSPLASIIRPETVEGGAYAFSGRITIQYKQDGRAKFIVVDSPTTADTPDDSPLSETQLSVGSILD